MFTTVSEEDEEAYTSVGYESHGGGCCGITHISDFECDYPKTDLKKVAEIMANPNQGGTHLYEIVLTDYQLKQGKYKTALQRMGFRLVTRFCNSNSSNVCNVFHCVTGDGRLPLRDRKKK